MKSHIKFSILSTIAFLLIASSAVFAQQSDFQIQRDFRAAYSDLSERVDNANTIEEFAALEEEIEALEARYSEHSSIINSAIYPETFSNRVRFIRNEAEQGRLNAERVEQLNEEISGLESERDQFRERLSEMDAESSELREEIERSSANERRQAALIRQYRQNIEQRDLFVMDFLEELLTKYEIYDASMIDGTEGEQERLDDNPLQLISTILSEYINSVDQASDLEPTDYLGMRAQHAYFDDIWDRIGENLANTFAPNEPVQAEQGINDQLSAWQASIDNKLWNSLTTAFNQNNIQLDTFTDAETFNTAVNRYIDDAIAVSQEANTEEDYEVFRNFNSFWNNTVKADWGDNMTQGNVLTQSQIASIDIKMTQWGGAATPTSNLMFILFLISIAVIIGLVVLLITKKEPKK